VCLLRNEKAGFEKSGIFQFNPNAIATAKYCPPPFIGHLHFPVHPLFSPVSLLFVHRHPVCRRTQLWKTVSVSFLLSPPLLPFLPGALKMVVVVQDCLNSPEPPLHQLFPPGVNPLVAAGLVPVNLADILAPPSKDAAASKKRSKRITGAREQTANEYTSCLKEEERKKKKRLKKKKGKRSEHKTLMPSPLDSYALSK